MRSKILIPILILLFLNTVLVTSQQAEGIAVHTGDKWDFKLVENTGAPIYIDQAQTIEYTTGDSLEFEITALLKDGSYGYNYHLPGGDFELASDVYTFNYLPNAVTTANWNKWYINPENDFWTLNQIFDVTVKETADVMTFIGSKSTSQTSTNITISYYKSTGILKESVYTQQSTGVTSRVKIENTTGAEAKSFFLANYDRTFNFILFVVILIGTSIAAILFVDRMKSYFQVLFAFDLGVILFYLTLVSRDILFSNMPTYATTAIASTILALFVLLGAFRFNVQIKQPYKSLVATTERILSNKDLSLPPGKDSDLTGELIKVNRAQKEAIGQLADIFRSVKQNSISLEKSLDRSINNSDQISNEVKVITDDVDQILQSASTISEKIETTRNEAIAILDQITVNFDALTELSNINDRLSDQTNLIAVNASIEAAQTEFESNFGTVADGIQRLASRSRENADKLQKSINSIRRSLENQINKFTLQLDHLEEDIIELGEVSNRSSSYVHQQLNYLNTIQQLLQDAIGNSKGIVTLLETLKVE